jgi:hypothetical protein
MDPSKRPANFFFLLLLWRKHQATTGPRLYSKNTRLFIGGSIIKIRRNRHIVEKDSEKFWQLSLGLDLVEQNRVF